MIFYEVGFRIESFYPLLASLHHFTHSSGICPFYETFVRVSHNLKQIFPFMTNSKIII